MEDGIERKYIMCKVYLWTKQYPEAKMALEKGQSMELDPDNISGYYDGDVFVFTSATLDRLCILGDAFEPCFEGAKIATSFSRLYTDFAQEVQKIIGGRYSIMDGKLAVEEVVDQITEETVEEVAEEVTEEVAETVETESESETTPTEAVEFTAEEAQVTEEVVAEEAPAESEVQEFTAQETEEVQETVEDSSSEDQADSTDNTEFTAQLDTLNKKIQELEQQLETYKQREAAEQEEKKVEMLDKYRKVLTAEEISPFEDNVSDYSLDDLEAKLSVIFARKTLVEDDVNLQFSLQAADHTEDDDLPDFMRQALAIDELNFNL